MKGSVDCLLESKSVSLWSTPSCIVVGCLMFLDGATELVVSDESSDAGKDAPVFDRILDTPERIFRVFTSEREILQRFAVAGDATRVRIWSDHPTEPEHILVVLG